MAARYDEGQLFGKFSALAAGKLPLNVTERLDDWARFGAGATENGVSLLFGHAEPLPGRCAPAPTIGIWISLITLGSLP